MFMLRSTHEATLKLRLKQQSESHKLLLADGLSASKRALDAERSITASLQAEVERLRPDAEKWQARRQQDRDYQASKRNPNAAAAEAKPKRKAKAG
jgi:hypothetical protein